MANLQTFDFELNVTYVLLSVGTADLYSTLLN